jgi:hypothetical protein
VDLVLGWRRGGSEKAAQKVREGGGRRARRRSFVAALLWMTANDGWAVGLEG